MAIRHFHPGVGQDLPTASPERLWSRREQIQAVRGKHPSQPLTCPCGPISSTPHATGRPASQHPLLPPALPSDFKHHNSLNEIMREPHSNAVEGAVLLLRRQRELIESTGKREEEGKGERRVRNHERRREAGAVHARVHTHTRTHARGQGVGPWAFAGAELRVCGCTQHPRRPHRPGLGAQVQNVRSQ